MCSLDVIDSEAKPQREITRRRRLWEIKSGWHCAIVGTCLSMGDLKSLFRKTRIRISNPDGTDFQLHSLFVQEALTKSRTCKLMNKLLEKKYATTIRHFQSCDDAEDIKSLWNRYCASGQVPEAFWAVMTHPYADETLCTDVYGEVHMLSHLVGSANHADMRAFHKMEEELIKLRETIDNDRRRFREKIGEKEQYIGILQAEAIDLKGRATIASIPRAHPANDQLACCLSETRNTMTDLKNQIGTLSSEQERLQLANAEFEARNRNLLNEIRALESTLMQNDIETDEKCPFNLNGKCILYVGGRSPQVCHLRKLVKQWNGELLHHDGGVEKSIDELARTVSKADTVVFPTDCVSHSAIHTVKRICRQNMTPYVPLRSTGVASLVAGLRKEFAENILQN